MLRPATTICALIMLSATANAQTQQGINRILRDQQNWKMKQLPANSVLRNFGNSGNAAISWMERNRNNSKNMQAIVMPANAESPALKRFSDFKMNDSRELAAATISIRTSFMQWLTTYLPDHDIP
jgi:hypothetical protein